MSDEKKSQAYNAIDSMVSLSSGLLKEAPSAEARKAIEEMVSQSVAAGLGNMGDVLQRHLGHLREWGDGVITGAMRIFSSAGKAQQQYSQQVILQMDSRKAFDSLLYQLREDYSCLS